jgi:hypothetical protein
VRYGTRRWPREGEGNPGQVDGVEGGAETGGQRMASGVGETGEGCGAGEVRRPTVWQQSIARRGIGWGENQDRGPRLCDDSRRFGGYGQETKRRKHRLLCFCFSTARSKTNG